MNGLIEIGDKVVLYGFFDGFAHKTDGTTNGLVTLKTGERVEIPLEDIMKKDQIITKKDIISRMKQLFPLSRNEWINEILHEFGDEFGLWKYNAGYEQGKLEGAMEREKVIVPQLVADWISFVKTNGLKFKNTYGFYEEIAPSDDVYRVMYYIFKESIADKEIREWVCDNIDTFARAWLDGYEVEKEKRYYVRLKGVDENYNYLNRINHLDAWCLAEIKTDKKFRTTHTRKELEDAGFGWVFDCEGIEIEEVEE